MRPTPPRTATPSRTATPAEPRAILLVEDDEFVRRSLTLLFESHNFDVRAAGNGTDAIALLAERKPDLVVSDLNLPGADGMSVLAAAREADVDLPVILITGYSTVEQAVAAIKAGAYDYVPKPILDAELLLVVSRAFEEQSLRQENARLRRELGERYGFAGIVGRDHRMQRLYETVETVAPTRATVIITGESGTGKTLIARALHHSSPRRAGPFVEVNCGALPETLLESELFGHVKGSFTGAHADRPGKFAAADGGTIFLDEIHDATPMLQTKLLRVLQDREFEPVGGVETRRVDVRVVLATNVDLGAAVEAGTFRRDLYYRIHVVAVEMPPLRERPADVALLAEHFRARIAKENDKAVDTFDEEALHRLSEHAWPGNVRELENCIERAVVLCRTARITVDDLPPALRGEHCEHDSLGAPGEGDTIQPLKIALERPERLFIERALRILGGNRQKTAEALGINRTTLFNKMRKYDLMDRY